MKIALIPAALAFVVLALPTPAGAQARTPDAMMVTLQTAGFAVTRLADNGTAPAVQLMVDGQSHEILMYNCKSGLDCMSFSVTASYTMPTQPTLAKINEWNATKRYVRARIDAAGRASLAVDVSLNAPGGMSNALIVDNVKWFLSMQRTFKTFIGFNG